MKIEDILNEAWSKKYKRSIDCSNPRGFSQRAHCQGRKKTDEAGSYYGAGYQAIKPENIKYNVPIYNVAKKIISNIDAIPEVQPEPVDNYAERVQELIKTAPTQIRDTVVKWLKLPATDPKKQSVVLALVGAILARVGAGTSHALGLSPYEQAIFFETMFPFAAGMIVSKMSGQSWSNSIKAGLAGAVAGAGLTAATGVVAEEFENVNSQEFDEILLKLCDIVLEGQEQNPDYYGMVGACVTDPEGHRVYRTSHSDGDKMVHAERVAIDAYEEEYGPVNRNCTVITTLSPCCNPMPNREGVSCAEMLDSKGITRVYAGYQDPTQGNRQYSITENKKIQELCKKLADTFLNDRGTVTEANREIIPTKWDNKQIYIAKLSKTGQLVRILKYSDDVGFSDQKGWLLIDPSAGGDRYPINMKWVPATTKFEWVRPFHSADTVKENFADGKVNGKSRPGRVKRAGASCSGSVTDLRKRAKNSSGEKAKMYHWCANMKSGKKK